MNALKQADLWLNAKSLDNVAKQNIETLKKTPAELDKAFGAPLDFGTGGIRKKMGLGSSLLNRYTIRMITEGLARALKRNSPKKELKVVISYDTRFHSEEFAAECACTLAAHNITAFLIKEPRPTPLLSFACRHLHCDAGIMITASHNPKEYNGYKVYNEHGGQIVSPWDKIVAEEIAKVTSPDDALTTDLSSKHIQWVLEELDDAYLKALEKFNEKYPFKKGPLSIGYTPLHGTGFYLVPRALAYFGFDQLKLVSKQCTFDGTFSTVHVPNPEEEEALSLGKKLIEHDKLDLLMATDPDADRLGVSVLQNGKAIDLNGNQIAQILLYRILQCRNKEKEKKTLSYAVTTIVSTRMLEKICRHFGVNCQYVLTGFKYIADVIEKQKGQEFIFGAEESYGYLFGDFVRDKDAVGASVLLARIAAEIKAEGKNLIQELSELSSLFGVHVEKAHSFTLQSSSPSTEKWLELTLQKCNNLLDKPIEIRDLSKGVLNLPRTPGLWILFDNHLEMIIRPSGTEPKVKLYILANSKPCSIDEVPKLKLSLEERIDRLLEALL